jgi:hypothetical protein
MHNRSEYRDKMSRRGQNGARIKWERYHENLPPKTYPPELPADCFRIIVENLITGKTDVMLFHPGGRAGRYSIDVNGVYWKTCGWTDAMVRIRKSCKRSPLYIYD